MTRRSRGPEKLRMRMKGLSRKHTRRWHDKDESKKRGARGSHRPPAKTQGDPTEFSTTPTPPYPPAPGNQSPPLLPPGACMPDTLESRRIKRGGPRIRGAQRRRVRSTIFRTHRTRDALRCTEPEPKRRPRPPRGEGEAARNNVVMSAGKRRCPDMICYLLSVIIEDGHCDRSSHRTHDCTVYP